MEDKSAGEEVETLSSMGFGGGVLMKKRQSMEWLDLPKELLIEIVKHLNNSKDILEFRSACKTWHSAIPHPISYACIPLCDGKYFLLQTKTYHLEPLSSPQSGSVSPSKGWVVKFGRSKGRHPFHFPIKHPIPLFPSTILPRVLNLIDFRVVELVEAYTLNLRDNEDGVKDDVFMAVPQVRKVVLVPSFSIEGALVFALLKNGKLRVCNIRHGNWTTVRCVNKFDDIILYKGQVYVVDEWGAIYRIDDSSLKLVCYSSLPFNHGDKKHLVESGGSLHVVDMNIGSDVFPYIIVYKEEIQEGRWLPVHNLGDVSFVLGGDSNFSLSAQECYFCRRNCIYFYDAAKLQCFSLERGMC